MSNELNNYQVGRDSDDAATGLIIALAVIMMIVMMIVMIIFGLGTIIGGFYSIKNYFVSFKHNVIDNNRSIATT